MQNNEILRSKLFFLDTQTYMARNFQFREGVLKILQNHLDEDDCHLLITDINVREIKSLMLRKSQEAFAVMKKARKEAMILRNTKDLGWYEIFTPTTVEEINEELVNQFQEFLDHPSVEILKTNKVDIDAIFDAYFKEEPPFANEGKKHEFPDAFMLHAIDDVSKLRGHLYVVSDDRDVKTFSASREKLISLGRIEELLELVLKNSERLKEPAKFAEEFFDSQVEEMKEIIRSRLSESDFDIIDDWEGSIIDEEIYDVKVEEIDIVRKNLTEVSSSSAKFEAVFKVNIIISISYPDYDRSPWDPEDKAYAFVLHNKVVRRYTNTAPVTVGFNFDDGIAANVELDEVDCDGLVDLSSAKIEEISFKSMDLSDDEEFGE